MKLSKSKRNNILFVVLLIIIIVPQTRQSTQVLFHKTFSHINFVNKIDIPNRVQLENYDWNLKDEYGRNYDFNSAKGKVVLINFWATWCPPCIAEMPSLQKLYDVYNEEVVFLFVTNEPKEVTSIFKNKNGLSFPVFQSHSNEPNEFVTRSIPRTLVIDKAGYIVIDKTGAVDWFSSSVKKQIDQLIMK